MSYFPKRTYYIGAELEKSTLKIAAIRQDKKGWSILQLKEVPLNSAVKPLDTLPSGGKLAMVVGAKEVFIRSLELPLKREKELRSALEFQASNILPFPPKQAIIDAQIGSREEGKTKLNLIAVRKDHFQKHLTSLEEKCLYPSIVTAPALALAALSEVLSLEKMAQLLVHIGQTDVTCALVQAGFVLKTFSFSAALSVPNEVRKIVLALSQAGRVFSFESIVLLGNVTDELLKLVQESTKKTTQLPTAISTFSLSQEKLVQFALAIGIAIAATKGINFRKKEFASSTNLTQWKAPLTFFIASSLALTALLSVFGTIYLSRQRKYIQKNFDTLLVKEGKSPCQLVTPQQYYQQLQQLKQEIQAKPDTFALQPMIPTVSEFLSWLIQQPIFSQTEDLKLVSFQYAMTKYPDLSHPKERYQAKVTMEFKSTGQQASKQLHELLSHEQLLIDQKQDIQWVSGKEGSVHVSLFLKDKTRYTG